MENNKDFMKRVEYASSLPAQTCRSLGPESQKDIMMYSEDKN